MTTEDDLYRVRDWEEDAIEMHRNDWRNLCIGVSVALGCTIAGGVLVVFIWWIL